MQASSPSVYSSPIAGDLVAVLAELCGGRARCPSLPLSEGEGWRAVAVPALKQHSDSALQLLRGAFRWTPKPHDVNPLRRRAADQCRCVAGPRYASERLDRLDRRQQTARAGLLAAAAKYSRYLVPTYLPTCLLSTVAVLAKACRALRADQPVVVLAGG